MDEESISLLFQLFTPEYLKHFSSPELVIVCQNFYLIFMFGPSMGADRILFWFYVRPKYEGQTAYYMILCAAWVWGADRILFWFYVRHEYGGQTAYYFDFMCGLSMRGRPHIILNLCAAWVWGADRILFCPLGRRPDIALVFLCVSRLMVEQVKIQNLKMV